MKLYNVELISKTNNNVFEKIIASDIKEEKNKLVIVEKQSGKQISIPMSSVKYWFSVEVEAEEVKTEK